MIQNDEKNRVRGFGKLPLIAAARFTTVDGVAPTVKHSAGIETIGWSSEGRWTLVLSNNVLDVLASGFPFAILDVTATVIAADAATIPHLVQVLSVVESTGTITIVHLKGSALATPTYSLQDDPGIDICVNVYALEA